MAMVVQMLEGAVEVDDPPLSLISSLWVSVLMAH
jgi:hypothetical protein